jgi:hypothetical protein
MGGTYAWARNLGGSPQANVAVQGETGAQPEGAFLNFVNRIGNVIAPVEVTGAVVGAMFQDIYHHGAIMPIC